MAKHHHPLALYIHSMLAIVWLFLLDLHSQGLQARLCHSQQEGTHCVASVPIMPLPMGFTSI